MFDHLCHFRIPASVSLLHLPEDVHVQQAFHLIPLLERVAISALLPLQLCVLA